VSVVTKEMLDAAVIVGRNQERERIIKLIWDNAEIITNQYFYSNGLIGEPTSLLVALIKGQNK